MPEGIPYTDIIILALIAGFILLRLRSVLGQKPDQDGLFSRELPKTPTPPEPVVRPDEKSLKIKTTDEPDPYLTSLSDNAISTPLNDIKLKDPLFSATHFLSGARLAFEMVFDAFAKGDKPTLKMLLADPIYQDFSHEIDVRTASDKKTETTLVSVVAKNISHAALDGNVARLTVHFASEQVQLVRNAAGDIIEGSASELHHAENDWTFERDVTSKNPNWKIVET